MKETGMMEVIMKGQGDRPKMPECSETYEGKDGWRL